MTQNFKALNLEHEIQLVRSAMMLAASQGKPSIVAALSRDLASLTAAQSRLDEFLVESKEVIKQSMAVEIDKLAAIAKNRKIDLDAEKLKRKTGRIIDAEENRDSDPLRAKDDRKRQRAAESRTDTAER